MKIGPLGLEDLDAMLALSTAEGWNQTAADWSRMLELAPGGCFAAREGPRLIGTVTTTRYGSALAWIGMMITHPDHRRQGIGAALMHTALDHLKRSGVATVKLDATPAGRPLYEALGFVAEADMERWTGMPRASSAAVVNGADGGAGPGMLALDRAAYGLDREPLLAKLVAACAGGPRVVPEGYALARRGRAASYVGPIVATSPSTAVALLDAMLARFPGEEVGLDLHRGGWLDPEILAARGFAKRRILTRMSFGPRSDAATGRAICASTGPEFG